MGKIPEKSGESRQDLESPKRTKKDEKGRTSPDRETAPVGTPPRCRGFKSQIPIAIESRDVERLADALSSRFRGKFPWRRAWPSKHKRKIAAF